MGHDYVAVKGIDVNSPSLLPCGSESKMRHQNGTRPILMQYILLLWRREGGHATKSGFAAPSHHIPCRDSGHFKVCKEGRKEGTPWMHSASAAVTSIWRNLWPLEPTDVRRRHMHRLWNCRGFYVRIHKKINLISGPTGLLGNLVTGKMAHKVVSKENGTQHCIQGKCNIK